MLADSQLLNLPQPPTPTNSTHLNTSLSREMIRSRSIPAVLSRVTGDGIHAILLVDADGELLGSHGTPPPTKDDINNIGGTITSTAIANNEKSSHWPLDAASIGALISEVAGDYRRMGEELLLLDPQYDSQRQSANNVDDDGQKDGSSSGGGVDEGSSSLQPSGDGGKTGKDKTDSGTNLKSLVIELDYVSSFY